MGYGKRMDGFITSNLHKKSTEMRVEGDVAHF